MLRNFAKRMYRSHSDSNRSSRLGFGKAEEHPVRPPVGACDVLFVVFVM